MFIGRPLRGRTDGANSLRFKHPAASDRAFGRSDPGPTRPFVSVRSYRGGVISARSNAITWAVKSIAALDPAGNPDAMRRFLVWC